MRRQTDTSQGQTRSPACSNRHAARAPHCESSDCWFSRSCSQRSDTSGYRKGKTRATWPASYQNLINLFLSFIARLSIATFAAIRDWIRRQISFNDSRSASAESITAHCTSAGLKNVAFAVLASSSKRVHSSNAFLRVRSCLRDSFSDLLCSRWHCS